MATNDIKNIHSNECDCSTCINVVKAVVIGVVPDYCSKCKQDFGTPCDRWCVCGMSAFDDECCKCIDEKYGGHMEQKSHFREWYCRTEDFLREKDEEEQSRLDKEKLAGCSLDPIKSA